MLRWKSSLKPPAAAASTGITLEDSAVTTDSGYSTPLNIDVNIPAVSTNDILLLLCTTDDQSDPTASPPSDWTKIAEQDGTSSSVSTTAAYWKRASSNASSTTETWSSFYPNGETYYIWVGAYSGCTTSGSPVDAYGTSAIGYSSSWSVDVTTTVSDAMIVTISGNSKNDRTHTWSDGTELIDTAYPGSLATVSINEKLEATSGSKTRTVTPSSATLCTMIAVALKPASASASSYDYEEDFEGTGTPTEFTNTIVGSGSIDYDYTTDPGSGSKSLEVVTSGGDSYAELDLGAVYNNFEIIFQNKRTGGGSNRNWIRMSDDTNYALNDAINIGNISGWGYGFNHNYNATPRTTSGVSTTDWHWVKLRVDIPNTTITLTISASSDFSSPDVASDTSQTFGSNFGGVRYIQFGGKNVAMTTFVDSITLEDLSISYATDDMTLDATWTSSSTSYSDLQSATSASAKVTCNFDKDDTGILMEAGGAGDGIILYIYNETLYFQCGEGSAGGDSDTGEVSYTITDTSARDFIIEWSADTSGCALYVDGTLIGTDAFSNTYLAGSNHGTIGAVAGVNVAGNRGSFGTSNTFSGTVTSAEIYVGEVTSDVSGL